MPYRITLAQLQTKVTQTVLVASAFLLLVIVINDSALGFYQLAALKFPMVLLFAWAWRKLQREGFKEKNVHLVNVPVLAFFTLNYLSNQGTSGPTLVAMLSMFVVYPVLLSPVWKWVYTIATLVLAAVLLFLGMDDNNLFRPTYASREEQFVDHLATIVAMGIYTTLLVSVVINHYRNQTTELAKAKHSLSAQIERTETEKRMKEELLGILAHDIKGPVINLRQILTLHNSGTVNEAALKKLLQSIDTRLVDLLSSVDNVLSHTRLTANGEADSGQTPLLAGSFTRELLDTLAYKSEAKHQTVHFHDLALNGASVPTAVRGELAIILKNLIDNAIKYSPEGSELTVRLIHTDGALRWEVNDAGDGIPARVAETLFTRAVTSREGTGIGLYLCKSIADRIGAELWFESSGQGSTFYLEFKTPEPA